MERIDALESYFNMHGYSNIDTDFSGMWEMFLVVFVRNELLNDVTKVKKQQIAKGKNGLFVTFGNKGGVTYNFKLKNMVFTAIATHLQHKQEKQEKRNKMSRELVNEFQLYEIQSKVRGLETDQLSDFSIFFGDLNYRLKTTFTDLNNSNVQTEAIGMILEKDQLVEAMGQGYYPGYREMDISFDPSYKMSTKKHEYVNKRDQAPSYCDRVLYKNNTSLTVSEESYQCHHDVYGSDHRPISLLMKIKNFKQPNYADITKLLDIENPRQGFGEMTIELVELTSLNFELIKSIKNLKALSEHAQPIQLRVSFFSLSLDTDKSPITFSSQQEIKLSQQYNLKNICVNWEHSELPIIRTAMNTVQLINSSRLQMFIWIGNHPLIGSEMMIGQVNINMNGFIDTTQMGS